MDDKMNLKRIILKSHSDLLLIHSKVY